MADVTYYVALPFVAADDGIAAGEPTECFNPNAAVMRAEALARKECVAFSRTGDPATGDFSDATVMRKFGRRAHGSELAVTLQFIWAEIEKLHLQIRRQQTEVFTFQRSGISTASAELLLARMQASVDALCILELALEDLISQTFPSDLVQSVPKGINGADIIQRVQNSNGVLAGSIIWESKNTKAWSDGWIQKIKDDQRQAKADIAIMVSDALPKDCSHFKQIGGIWVTHPRCAIHLASAQATIARSRFGETGCGGKKRKDGNSIRLSVGYRVSPKGGRHRRSVRDHAGRFAGRTQINREALGEARKNNSKSHYQYIRHVW